MRFEYKGTGYHPGCMLCTESLAESFITFQAARSRWASQQHSWHIHMYVWHGCVHCVGRRTGGQGWTTMCERVQYTAGFERTARAIDSYAADALCQ